MSLILVERVACLAALSYIRNLISLNNTVHAW